MARTIVEIPLHSGNVTSVLELLQTILSSKGYSAKMIKDEYGWSKGDGIFFQMKCFSAMFTENSVIIQGWVQNSLKGECAIEHFPNPLTKSTMTSIMDNIKYTIISRNL